MQSHDYVPGVSGWKSDHISGDFEINSAHIQVGSLPSDPQLITVTVGSWSEYDLPANALERLAFIGAELNKIPAECRESAEFTTEGISFDRDGSDIRTTLIYERRETAEEVKARQEKAKVAGTSIKFEKGAMTITHNGVARVRLGDLDASPSREAEAPLPKPFVDVDGVTYIRQAEVKAAIVAAARAATKQPSEFEKAMAEGADAVLETLTRAIGDMELAEQIDKISLGSINERLDELTEKQGGENSVIAERIDALQAQVDNLQGKVFS